MTTALIAILVSIAALASTKYWLTTRPNFSLKASNEKLGGFKLFFFYAVLGVFLVLLLAGPYQIALAAVIVLVSCTSFVSARNLFLWGIREQGIGTQISIFALWAVHVATFAFAFYEFINARANVT